jgi:uncharacterized protein YodC (DUF2158 family)
MSIPAERHQATTERRVDGNDIKAGQIVQLKSGGPRMTVESLFNDVHGKRCVKCVWFSQNDLTRDVFQIEALQLI